MSRIKQRHGSKVPAPLLPIKLVYPNMIWVKSHPDMNLSVTYKHNNELTSKFIKIKIHLGKIKYMYNFSLVILDMGYFTFV